MRQCTSGIFLQTEERISMNKEAMTAVEVAEMLNIAKNTVYELVKRGELNCYKVGRKMRFTYEDVQRYIQESREETMAEKERDGNFGRTKADFVFPSGDRLQMDRKAVLETARPDKVFRLCGQDEILDMLLKYLNRQMPNLKTERVYKGSYDSLAALYKDQVSASASHMWDMETNTYNFQHVRRLLPGCPAVIIHICSRTEGFYVAEGNPKKIKGWEDLKRYDISVANREPGAGSRVLLDEHLVELGIDGRDIEGYCTPRSSHLAVAAAVSKGEADIGVGTKKVALSIRGIDFIPLQEESYDLVIKKHNMPREPYRRLVEILQSPEFQEEFRFVNGYDIADMGKILGTVNE